MGQGNYDHPSYLTRQQIAFPKTTAGATGTSAPLLFGISNVRLRNAAGVVVTAGTVGTGASGEAIIKAQGTGIIQYPNVGGTNALSTSTGVVALGTIGFGTGALTQWFTSTSGDMNAFLPAGSQLFVVGGTDATITSQVTVEAYLDPAATWTGNMN
jgi:hypothetical protein